MSISGFKLYSFSFQISHEFRPAPSHKEAASQKTTCVLVVWNSRARFPIEISLSVAVRCPGSPTKTYLAQLFLKFGISTLPLWHCLEGG